MNAWMRVWSLSCARRITKSLTWRNLTRVSLDKQVLALALDENRLLLTEDKDFGDLVFRSRMEAPGVILLRLGPQHRHLKWGRLEAAIKQFGATLFGRYVVIEETRMRSRPLLKWVRLTS